MIKICSLVKLLDKNDLAVLKQQLGAKTRLFRALRYFEKNGHLTDGDTDRDKVAAFRQIFSESYTQKKDALLRNEIRLLSNTIRSYLEQKLVCQSAFDQTSNGKQLLLKFYWKCGAHKLFVKEWKQLVRKLQQANQFELLSGLHELYAEYLQATRELAPDTFEEVELHLAKAIDYRKKACRETIRRLEWQRSRVNRNMQAFVPGHKMPALNSSIEMSATDEEVVVEYFEKRALIYHHRGVQKMNTLQQLIDLYPKAAKYHTNIRQDISTVYGTIGLEHFLAGRYEEANLAYQKGLQEAERLKLPFDLKLYFNYLSNLQKLEHYRTIVEAIQQHEDAIFRSSLKYRFEYMLVMSYLLSGEAEPAFERIHKDINRRPESEYYNFRFVYAICFYMLDDIDSFERELINIQQKINYSPPMEKDYQVLIVLFQLFLKWKIYSVDEAEKQKLHQRILQELDRANQEIPFFKDFLIAKWLLQQL